MSHLPSQQQLRMQYKHLKGQRKGCPVSPSPTRPLSLADAFMKTVYRHIRMPKEQL